MADKKISQLTPATTPLAGTEVLPIVQSNSTVKVAVSDLTGGLSTIPTTKGGTGLTSFTEDGVVYADSTSSLTTGSALSFDGTNLSTTGTATATSLIPSGSSMPANGMYLPLANSVALSSNNKISVFSHSSGNVSIGNLPVAFPPQTQLVVTGTVSGGSAAGPGILNSVLASFNGISLLNQQGSTPSFGGMNVVTDPSAWYKGYLQFTTNSVDGTSPDTPATEKMRLTSVGGLALGTTTDPGAGNLAVSGNVVIATSGKGIDFSATASGSGTMTSELLADYEEGTWTPTLSFTSGSVTYNAQNGTYTKVGNVVTLNFWIYGNTVSSPAGDCYITGLPYATGGTQTRPSCLVRCSNLSITGQISMWAPTSNTYFILNVQNDGTASAFNAGSLGAGFELSGSISYVIA